MDYATKLALRAIVSGLHHAGTIDQRHISKIVEALVDADEKAGRDNQTTARVSLRQLCMDIARDGQVDCPITHADPPMDWKF
ncbi:hypothetical protein [Sphingobium yanoikuyae]|uniref:Uncharacterized protein n=1 Tax=Sphingobium yanoikuyae TaxID=13690 RepID=A0A430BZA2_SPHYA|nr:hypothetical protein [Sphingobium yanoikuyae]RSU58034.1 hypothetical protein DAH51_07265 [Sphingobium yanoikuyae]